MQETVYNLEIMLPSLRTVYQVHCGRCDSGLVVILPWSGLELPLWRPRLTVFLTASLTPDGAAGGGEGGACSTFKLHRFRVTLARKHLETFNQTRKPWSCDHRRKTLEETRLHSALVKSEK